MLSEMSDLNELKKNLRWSLPLLSILNTSNCNGEEGQMYVWGKVFFLCILFQDNVEQNCKFIALGTGTLFKLC